MGENRPYALARSEDAALLVAIVAVLAAGIVAAFLLPTAPNPRAARENGSLLAPPSEGAFNAAFGEPGAPSSAIGSGDFTPGPGNEPPPPAPRKPSPRPGPGTPPPPPDDGLLGLVDDLLPPLPPPPRFAAARALERVAKRLALR